MSKKIVLDKDQKENFTQFLALCDKYKSSWFWSDNGNAYTRNHIENRDYLDYSTTVNGVHYSVYFSVSLSRKNANVNKQVYKDGVKTTARVIRTLVEKDTGKAA